ncbi:hypothetical protein GCM10020255_015450 [Rhodococcus baikonurensis]
MDTGSLTEKSREALQEAQNVATRMGHTEVDGEHLLLALVDQQDGLVPRLLEQAARTSMPCDPIWIVNCRVGRRSAAPARHPVR